VLAGQTSLLKLFPHPAIYVGNFNSHNQLWGYKHNYADGNWLLEWMTLNKLHLIYHLFKSARWGNDYTPDLTIVTRAPVDDNTLCNRYIIKSFPRSQHRPVLLHYGICVPLTESIEKPRWNFSSVDWESFAADIDHVVWFILACSDSYARFSNAIRAASKCHVPRGFQKAYIQHSRLESGLLKSLPRIWQSHCKLCTGRVERPKWTKVGKHGRKHEFHPF
jgi:hypothetical protein